MASPTLAAPCFISLTVPELQGCTQAELALCSLLLAMIQAVPTPQPRLPPALQLCLCPRSKSQLILLEMMLPTLLGKCHDPHFLTLTWKGQ